MASGGGFPSGMGWGPRVIPWSIVLGGMVLRAGTRVKKTVKEGDIAPAEAVSRAAEDAAAVGFRVSLDETPSGGTNSLRESAFEPRKESRGRSFAWTWGWTAPYAEFVNDGTAPHWIPLHAMPSLKLWARRVLGDESAAWAVRRKIAEEGTDPQNFAEAGLAAASEYLRTSGVAKYLKTERR